MKLAQQPGRSFSAVAREFGIERSVLKRRVENFAAGRYEKDKALPLKAAQQQENARCSGARRIALKMSNSNELTRFVRG